MSGHIINNQNMVLEIVVIGKGQIDRRYKTWLKASIVANVSYREQALHREYTVTEPCD